MYEALPVGEVVWDAREETWLWSLRCLVCYRTLRTIAFPNVQVACDCGIVYVLGGVAQAHEEYL